MFKKEEQGGETIIAAGVRVEGEFVSKGRVIIEGEVLGNIKTEDDIQIGEQAKIVASVSAKNGVIAGEVKGNLRIKERLDLTSSANVRGDITASVLSIEAGANLNGKCSIGEGAAEKVKLTANKEEKTEEEK